MKLQKVKKVIYEVEHHDFNNFVDNIYGGSYEIVADLQLNNNSSYSFTVRKDQNVLSDAVRKSEIKNGVYKGTHNFHYIIECLVEDGHLTEEGEYLITIDW